MKRQLYLIILILSGFLTASGQTFHIRCLSTDNAGGVTVTWDRNLLNGADFRCFYIYHSTSQSGPFTAIDSVFFFNDTVETDAAANAANNAAWYYVGFKTNNGSPELFSDTVRAIQLTVLNPGSGFANLAWNVMRIPLIATHSPFYKIYREYPPGFFTLIDSVDASTSANPMLYSDLISICDDTIKYKVEVMDNSGCRNRSNVDGDLFRDLQPPSFPVLDSVSVNASGLATIGWPVNPSPDTRAYVILQSVGSIWTPIDTVFGRNNTSYVSTVSAAGNSVSFEVIAVDSCGNPSPQSSPHSTIYLDGAFLLCEKSVAISWNPYSYWSVSPVYEIWRSENGGPELLQGTTLSTSYSDSNIVSGNNYCYRVIAREIGSARSSTSSRYCITPAFPPPPVYSSIRKVSVISSTQVLVVANVDPNAVVSGYELLRADNPAGPFSSVGSQQISGVSTVSFTDNVSSTAARVYYYKIATIDSCGLDVLLSGVSHTILLTGQTVPDFIHSLTWTDYGNWPTGVGSYNVYKTINGIRNPVPVAVIFPGTQNSFADTVLDDFYSDGNFCYVIEAVEAPGNPDFFLDSAFSNEICLLQEATIFVPNAFHPGGGINEIFRPYPVFVSTDEYKFMIFNRWGEEIFSTNDPQVGWDGSIEGAQAQEAVYVYMIEAKQSNGEKIQKVGSVTLIR